MNNNLFYQLLDNELDSIIDRYKEEEPFFKRSKEAQQLKSYSFMVWFLEFYGKILRVRDEIVDGPGDFSCDIIFPITDSFQETTYYVVQSKWNNINKCNSMISSDEVKKALNDFDTILRGAKINTINQRFNDSVKGLKEHIHNNGKVEFLFITLSQNNPDIKPNIESFENNNPNMFIRILDIEQIKRDFIDIRYKKLEQKNILKRSYNPKEEEIDITLERLGTTNNQIVIQEPFKAFILLIRPKLLYELFEKYSYSLFIENVRNPIKKSDINDRMQETLLKNPSFFWYYNNGITAITNSLPTVSKQAKKFTIIGLQIINGAQTVSAIHSAYHSASTIQRKRMDEDVLLTLRLFKSGGEDFNRNVTKFTNAQNKMDDRDFWANDPIQVRIQNESFSTRYWYEKRKDEFIDKPDGITVLSNKYLAGSYISFYYQIPNVTKEAFKDEAIEKFDILFLSKKEEEKFGWYEFIFNSDTKYLDLLVSELVFTMIRQIYPQIEYYNNLQLSILGLFKTVLEKYLQLKYTDSKNINSIQYVYDKYEKNEITEFQGIIKYLYNYITNHYSNELITDDEAFLNKEINSLKVLLSNSFQLDSLL